MTLDLNKIKNSQVIKNLQTKGEVFLIGGVVRDFLMKKPCKDIDIIVRLIPIEELIKILKLTGKVDLVGESFGVIKYIDNEIELDIALPRKDFLLLGEKGHKAIDAQSDPYLSLESDLYRRDFTMNSIAMTLEGKIIDPFGGWESIFDKKINCTNPNSFIEDPLRILRALQFSLRFDFDLGFRTEELIFSNKEKLYDIPAERITMEFEKILKVGILSEKIFSLFNELEITNIIFGNNIEIKITSGITVKKLSELFNCIYDINSITQIEEIKNKFKISTETERELKAYLFFKERNDIENPGYRAFKAIEIAKDTTLYDSPFILGNGTINQFLKYNYPFTINDLQINGNEIMEFFNLKGKEIGDAKENLIKDIFDGHIKNNKRELFQTLKDKIKI